MRLGALCILCLANYANAQDGELACEQIRKSIPAGINLDAIQLGKIQSVPESEDFKWFAEGFMRICGLGVPVNFSEGASLMQRAASKGNRYAVSVLFLAYATGQFGFPKDLSSARDWLRIGAEKGDSDIQYLFGTMLMSSESEGGLSDRVGAERWLLKAAANGNTAAMLALGRLHAESSRYSQAFPWLQMAAVAGQADAFAVLSGMYLRGQGVPIDKEQALYWAQLAADKKLPEGYVSMAELLEEKADYAGAVKWYQQAIEKGYVAKTKLAR
jgi:uncharacterized protein